VLNELEIILKKTIQETNDEALLPLISFSEPLFFIINFLDTIFLGYVLQERTLVKNGKRADIRELYVSQTNFEVTLEMLQKRRTVYETLNMSSEKYRIGKIGNKVFPEKKIKDVSEIENRIPIKSYYLDIDLTVNSEYQELVVKSRENRLKDYSSSSSQGLYYKQKENKNKVNILKKDMPNSNFKYIDIGEIDEYLSARNRI